MYSDQSFQIAILRAISAIPLHASCGVIMGYYIGLYAFKGKKIELLKALVIPVFIHAFYNFLAGYSGELIFFGYLICVIYFANKLHKEFVYEQQIKISETETKLR